MNNKLLMYNEISEALLEKGFLKEIGLPKKTMKEVLLQERWTFLAEEVLQCLKVSKRASSKDVLNICSKYIKELSPEPKVGWLSYIYAYLLGQVFPHMCGTNEETMYKLGRVYFLQILRGVYEYERREMKFDPNFDIRFLSDGEIQEKGYTQEYEHLHKLVRSKYIYEFMRIGVDITPYNTLGHIAGVHYVAMYMARQLEENNVSIDLGLISGAAAGHDIGKYGCRKSEERRIPYLHYYYTDMCYNRFDMPTIGHIAANHSTWDLELENLSVESLLLIYADFRVKSSRDENNKEIVNFYSLAQAYDVILNKLDNVDEAKKLRYQKVYDKLSDFENYMVEMGVNTYLPEDFSEKSKVIIKPKKRELVLLEGMEVVNQLKFSAIDHNIKLMSKFHGESSFGNLIEAARSERQWKNIRTYISIFGEYSTYMSEKQKLMTIKFLYELLSHKEGDIRSQAAEIMGEIIANFSEEYKKELPEGAIIPEKTENNLTLFEKYLELILFPDHKFTEQHKKWISNCLKNFVNTVLCNCRFSCAENYFQIFEKYLNITSYDEDSVMVILNATILIDPNSCQRGFIQSVENFLRKNYKKYSKSIDIGILKNAKHFFESYTQKDYGEEIRKVMNISHDTEIFNENLGAMFLDDLKTKTPWIEKAANISFMLEDIDKTNDKSKILHVATHLANLVKVSETITVRKAAGDGLLHLIEKMPLEQRNELTVELFNGLEIGDYQFSKYIPDYLGIIMLYLPPKELDESVDELQKVLETSNEMAALSVINTLGVMIENYSIYKGRFMESTFSYDKRRFKLVNLLIKAFAGYNRVCSQEAFWTFGTHVFGGKNLTLKEKTEIFQHCYKKIATLLLEKTEKELDFYNNAAVLNHMYRFIGQHQVEVGDFQFEKIDKVAFFPGTYDPFSIGHKAVATTIRDMGFQVYLALDEFSWSKNTQPRLLRRNIMTMSIADEDNIYIFPEDIPVNIANPKDIKTLKETFRNKELYIAVGTDVIKNASSYKAAPTKDSIHTMNHIAFARESNEQGNEKREEKSYPILGKVINLTLKKYYEDVSSTRIRENIDLNRDISNLIDPVAQNYIYDKNLYLREPAYKHVLQSKEINISEYRQRDISCLKDVGEEMIHRGYNIEKLEKYLEKPGVRTLYVEAGVRTKKIAAFAAAHRVGTNQLLDEFKDTQIAAHIREKAAGSIAVIGGLFSGKGRSISNVSQIVITEILTELIAKDFAYVVYHPVDGAMVNVRTLEALKKQGFVNIADSYSETPIYAVDMKAPIIIFRDVETVIKSPLNKNTAVVKVMDEAHNRLLKVLTKIYPGQLILSFNTSAVHNKIINKVTEINKVPKEPSKSRTNGRYMSVPFGKALADVVVPNTVTKALHTEKYYDDELKDFTIAESKYYSALDNQAKTIKSFNRPIILIDDLLHKGYRMNIIDPILKKNRVEVKEVIVGVLTGNARDLMEVKNRDVKSAYFIPTLKLWINERDCYPFIGGDSMNKDKDTSINLIMPYTMPGFIKEGDAGAIYNYSMTCLENARDILKVLETEYQAIFEKKLTLKRLGEVITYPKHPDIGEGVSYDENLAPSAFVENDIQRLRRLGKK